LILDLDTEDVSLLRFILDVAINDWKAHLDEGMTFLSQEPGLESLEEMLSLVATQPEMIARAEGMLDRLNPKEEPT
jgi:hypothetical protein